MGFGKWFLVLAAGGVGAGVVVAGMTTGRMQKYPDGYALGGEARHAARDDEGSDERGYALSDGDYTGSDHSGYGPPRGRMVPLGGAGWADDGYAGAAPRWSDQDGEQDESDAGDGRPFIGGLPQRPPHAILPGSQSSIPQQAAPRPSAPARDSAAESAARAAGAAADVLAAEREGS